VRKLVPESMEAYKPDDATVKRINAAFGVGDPAQMRKIHELEIQAIKGSVGAATEPSTSETTFTKLFRINGNSTSSFRGRQGIYEVLPMSTPIQKLVISGASSEVIQEEAIKEGMVTMQMDGFIKALRGQTTLEEIMRVTSER
jgi:type II secretory ATPase GspE/PulE/Tfp pilus assembly ATPase PilB-like protein